MRRGLTEVKGRPRRLSTLFGSERDAALWKAYRAASGIPSSLLWGERGRQLRNAHAV